MSWTNQYSTKEFLEGHLYWNDWLEIKTSEADIELDKNFDNYQRECMALFIKYQSDQLKLFSNYNKI